MDEPARTVNYFIAGYTVIFIGLSGYLVSMYLRWKKLLAEKKMLERQMISLTLIPLPFGHDVPGERELHLALTISVGREFNKYSFRTSMVN